MQGKRIGAIDSGKGVLILLVVLGHLIEPTISGNEVNRMLYLLIYSFHMPVFVFLSGMLSDSKLSAGSVRKWVESLVVPLVVFQLLYEIPDVLSTGHLSAYTSGLQPYWMLWYLASLFVWRVGLPCLMVFRHPLLIALCVAILSGYVPQAGYFLGISRTLTFFPFFVAGHLFGKQAISRCTSSRHRLLFLPGIALVLLWLVVNRDVDHRWLLGSLSYHSLGHDTWWAGLHRLLYFSLAVIAGASFFAMVPDRESCFGRLGRNSMFVFLWHGFLVRVLTSPTCVVGADNLHPGLSTVLYALEAVVVCRILSSDVVASHTKMLLSAASGLVCDGYPRSKSTSSPAVQHP